MAVLFNAITISPLVPWQQWRLWSNPTPYKTFSIVMEDYQIKLPSAQLEINTGSFVEFSITTNDVTYGFGVFRSDGTLVFQTQVIPGYDNRFLWKFDATGLYTIRSTEYSGPRHSEMVIKDAIRVR